MNVHSKQNNNLSWNIPKLHGNTRFKMFSIFIKIEKSVISFRKLSQTIYQRFQRRRSPIHVTDKDPIVHPLRRVMENSIWRRWGLPMIKSLIFLPIKIILEGFLSILLVKPYLFTHPNPTNVVISWTIGWPASTVFLHCMVWFAN